MRMAVFRRPPSAAWSRCRHGRRDDCFGADVFGHELGVLAEAVAGSLNLHHDGMVEQPVEEGGGDDGIAEHLTPFGKAAVGGEDHGAAFVAGVHPVNKRGGRIPVSSNLFVS